MTFTVLHPKARIGDYHAIYMIKKEAMQFIVLYVGHRRNVYDDFSRIF
ncbi:hypothetical protein JXL21_07950 [Candidatus Bathyarchaeota archaeon]|nr:hypothetical protein [Candidatus Bathyarchaeota archaeon]